MNKNYRMYLTAILSVFILMPSCNLKDESSTQGTNNENPTVKKLNDKEASVQQFYVWPNKVDSFKVAFKENFNEDERYLIWSLNRVDAQNSAGPDTLIIPENVNQDIMDFSPFPPQLAILQPVNKIVIFSYPLQVFGAYENGILMNWGPTSLGTKAHPTPTGLHFANWKSEETISTVDDEWILPWNFNIKNLEGVGWHEYSMPGYPASHSCLRLLNKDALWLYDFAEQWIMKDDENVLAEGTPVIVYGAFPFGERSPWLNALENPESVVIKANEMTNIISEHLNKIMEKQKERESQLSSN